MLNSKTQPYQDNDNAVDRNSNQTLDTFLAGVEQRAYRMAYIATSNKDDALDIVQDAMMTLVNKYSQRHYNEWPPLFYRIIQNTIRDWYRRQSVRNKFRQWFSGNGSADSDLEQDWESQAMQQAVNLKNDPTADQNQNDGAMLQLMSALNQLPVRQQQTFLLRCWEGLDTKQTAAAMSISEGSVKTHYSRAVHELRNQLGDHYGD